MDQKILQVISHLIDGDRINLGSIYEMFFMGSLMITSIMAVAYFYRRNTILIDLFNIKDATKDVLREVEEKEKNKEDVLNVYEPALLEPRELQNKLDKYKCKLAGKWCCTADRTVRLLIAVRGIEENLRKSFKTVMAKNMVIIAFSVAAIFSSGISSILDFSFLIVLTILFVGFVFRDLKKFLEDMDAIPQENIK